MFRDYLVLSYLICVKDVSSIMLLYNYRYSHEQFNVTGIIGDMAEASSSSNLPPADGLVQDLGSVIETVKKIAVRAQQSLVKSALVQKRARCFAAVTARRS